ncbi:glucosamine inositolphosphorylceramide transferase family protein [Haloarcula sp. GH36]|uniref:glucosamine inositolphosphorylceramide transferase family protein n=1 Tax=Haloarcula montana TaxID=3111776 RepID=UPI002D76C9F7|nr:hypothetical protein [Haloarcula sp. GH36]
MTPAEGDGSAPADSDPTRVAVACSGLELPSWQARVIQSLRAVDSVSIVLLLDESPATGRPASVHLDPGRRLSAVPDATTDPSWSVWDNWQRLTPRPGASTVVDLRDELGGVERVPVQGRREDGAVELGERARRAVSLSDLDVLVRLGGLALNDEAVLSAPTYGVWEFRYGGDGQGGTWPPCVDELRAGHPVTHAALWRVTGTNTGVPLRRGTFPTVGYSWPATVDRLFVGSAGWPAAVAVDIAIGEADYLDGESVPIDREAGREPGVGGVAGLAFAQVRAAWDLLTSGSGVWSIGVTDTPIEAVVADPAGTDFEWFPLPDSRRFVADPFPVRIDGDPYLLFEEFPFDTSKGVISALSLDDDLSFANTEVVFEQPFHLSYPYAFVHDGSTYVTPEMAEGNEIRLYELHGPAEWDHVETLVPDVMGIDPTVIQHDGRWWLFCTLLDELPETNLHVYHAPELRGDWVPHANNPVKTDVRSVRPAGTPWTEDGTLYRPGQYCAGGYGKRVVVNRVDRLTPTAFEETVVGELVPDADGPYAGGRHTLAANEDITVIDGYHSVVDTYHTLRRARIVLQGLSNRLPRFP